VEAEGDVGDEEEAGDDGCKAGLTRRDGKRTRFRIDNQKSDR
jgi:hypothetical protein